MFNGEFAGDAEDRYVDLYVHYGFDRDKFSRPNFNKWDAENNRGEVSFLEKFDVFDDDSIRFLLQTCRLFKDEKCGLGGCDHVAKKLAVPFTQKCPMDEFLASEGVTQSELDATACWKG